MNRYVIVGVSPCCQSNLIAGKNDLGLFVFCDECDLCWDSVEKISDSNCIISDMHIVDYPTKEEVEEKTNWPILDVVYDSNRFFAEEEMNRKFNSIRYLCPVCNVKSLREPPYDSHDIGSFEMCNVCGYILGKYDGADKDSSHKLWANSWNSLGGKTINKLPMFERMVYCNKVYEKFHTSCPE